MKIKTSELTGTALDWAVAKCEGYFYFAKPEGPTYVHKNTGEWHHSGNYSPSTNWSQGGPIIDREEIGIKRNAPCTNGRQWEASPSITPRGTGGKWGYGPTPRIAAMRCYVASKLGDEVDVPKELV